MKIIGFLLSIVLSACGKDGSNGLAGRDGFNSLISLTKFDSNIVLCPSGSGVLVKSGDDIDQSDVLDADEVTAASIICDGEQGSKGDQGDPGTPAPQYAVTKFITPCASIGTPYREALLRLANGTILSSFSDSLSGANTRLVVLPPGDYIDSDGSNCHFTIAISGILTDQEGGVFTP